MKKTISDRRKFITNIAGSAATIGILSITSSVKAVPLMFEQADHLDDWFKKIKGKHRIVYDANINFSLIAFVLLL
ncbi:MAG: hypothetical protein WKF85_15375 [Chitinophagaceae bacterium]